ncbi:MAG: hypothetical protein [Cystoviridae sp.]|nr:MAG: hypothetical protein [Cystoviridae sp.]
MPIINTVVNEATDEEITFAKGIVKRILFKDGSPKQQQMGTVKIASIILQSEGEDDVFVRMNLKKDEERVPYVEGKAGSEKWYDLQQGDEVKITISKQGVWNDKPTYETTMKRIKVTKRAEGNVNNKSSAPAKAQEKKTYTPRDTTGMEVGHAVNGGFELVRSGASLSPVEAAKVVHNATVTLKAEEAKKRGVEPTNYDVGASVGHAILNACKNSAGKITNEKDLITEAKGVLDVSEEITAYVKGGETKASPVKEEKKQEVKKPAEEVHTPPVDFDDSDLPF